MEVLLREDVDKLGRRGEVVKVAEGYGRNFLLPRGLALPVTEANKSAVERERKAHEARAAKEKAELELLATRLSGMRFVAPRKVGEHDVLYGSVTSGDIAEFLKRQGHRHRQAQGPARRADQAPGRPRGEDQAAPRGDRERQGPGHQGGVAAAGVSLRGPGRRPASGPPAGASVRARRGPARTSARPRRRARARSGRGRATTPPRPPSG